MISCFEGSRFVCILAVVSPDISNGQMMTHALIMDNEKKKDSSNQQTDGLMWRVNVLEINTHLEPCDDLNISRYEDTA